MKVLIYIYIYISVFICNMSDFLHYSFLYVYCCYLFVLVFCSFIHNSIPHASSHNIVYCLVARFAQRVSLIKNRATINEDMDPSLVIKRLKTEILSLREEIAFLKVVICVLMSGVD